MQKWAKTSFHASLFTKYNHCYCHVLTVPQQKMSDAQRKPSKCQEKWPKYHENHDSHLNTQWETSRKYKDAIEAEHNRNFM